MHKVPNCDARENKSGHPFGVDEDAAVGEVEAISVGFLWGPRVPVESVPGVHDTNPHPAVAYEFDTHSKRNLAGPCEQFIF
jgi:hypothetical protein